MQRMPEPLCKGKVMHLLRWVPVVPCVLGLRCMCHSAQDRRPAAPWQQRLHAALEQARSVRAPHSPLPPCCRDTAAVLLAVGGASLSVMSLHCCWSSDVMRVSAPVVSSCS
jgi:hypothetical protein